MNDHILPGCLPDLLGLRRLVGILEYDGTNYHGFQSQKNARSIQDVLESAIFNLSGERLRIKGAGRTDAGVHANGQVVAFDTWSRYSPLVFLRGLNHYLPNDISVRDIQEVSLDFDPRRWATSREYVYKIINRATPSPLLKGFAHHIRRPLDTLAMEKAARHLEGERDFAPFSGPLSNGIVNTRRTVFKCSVSKIANIVLVNMIANSFLPQQVRRTAGALLDVGLGKTNLDEFTYMVKYGKLGAATNVLPAKGLSLVKVSYPMILFSSEVTMDLQEHQILEAGVM